MWHFRFLGKILSVLALLGFMQSQTALAAHSTLSEFSMSQSQETRGLDGSFQLAVMGGGAVPLDIPTETFPKKVKSEKPAAKKPKATVKASKPKKKKVKTAKVKAAPAKKPAVAKEKEGFFTKTFKTLVGSDDDKKNPAAKSLVKKDQPEKKEDSLLTKTMKTLVGDEKKKTPSSKPQLQKTAGKKSEPEKKDEGLFTKTLKSLVGDEKKEKKQEKAAKKDNSNPLNMVPTASGSTTKKKKKKEEPPKTAISKTKKNLKDSFEKLIGVGTKDEGDSKTAKKEESGGLLDSIMGGSDKKDSPKQAKVTGDAAKKKEATAKPAPKKRITARKYIEEEEAQLEKDRGGVKKGKNVLKESFKTLINDEKKKTLAE